MRKLVIIDGKSVFYRGYYAMGNLARKDGTPTAGVYGFAVIAMEIVRQLKPEKVIVAWDKAKTSTSKRTALYPEYKAGRVRPPEDFYVQIPLLVELVKELSWNFVECDEYEADDIIGTLSKQADEVGDYLTYIVSSDLDMLQIVDENTKMYRLLRGFSKLEEIDVKAVEEKYGVKKRQFLDLKALKGDTSDNIPGVPGVGEKTAVELLKKYDNLTEVYENLAEIPGKLREKLKAGEKHARLSYQLAKIMLDAPVKLDEMQMFEMEPERVVKALKNLEFYSLVRKFEKKFPKESFRNKTKEEEKEPEAEDEERKLPKDLVVEWDVKKEMHENEELAEKILAGQKFWDLNQGRFLLDPLARREEEKKVEEYWRQRELFGKEEKLRRIYEEFDLPLIPVLYKMEKKGILIDRRYFAELKKEFEQGVWKIEQEIYAETGVNFNINSPQQLAEVLFGKLELPTKGIKKTTKGFSTGAKELEKLKKLHPVIDKLMEYREAAKLLNTYITPLSELADKEDRIHTTFTQNVTATGRLSSLNPNLQNIPVRTEAGRRIRGGFVAPKGRKLISADYAQFELRLAAALSKDEKLIEIFNEGVDIHTKTAAEVFNVPMEMVTKEQRRAAKVINFGVLYGMSAKGLADAAGMGVTEAKKFIEDYFAIRRPIREYLDATLRQAKEQGFVETYFGRRRPTPDVKSTNFVVRMAAERAAENMPIQGTEADLMKRAMIRVSERLPKGAELILQIHDSLIVECDDGLIVEVKELMREVMEEVAPELMVKLAVEVEVGQNWGEL